MSMYGDSEWDKNNLYDELREFLKDHKVSELLKIVTDAVEYMEEVY